MSKELPVRSEQHIVGERGLAILKLAIPRHWILRNQAEGDYGIDVEIEISEDGKVTGQIFKAQVRTKTNIRWTQANTYSETFGSGKLLYWRSMGLPIVLFLVDESTQKVYWESATGAIPADPKVPSSIVVSKANVLSGSLPKMKDYVLHFSSHSDARDLLYQIPFFLSVYRRRQEMYGLDYPGEIDPAGYSETSYVYEETKRLRTALGLDNKGFVPWQWWLIRSTTIFGDGSELHNGVHDEIVDYLKPHVDEILTGAKRILDSEELNSLNFSVKNALEIRGVVYGAPTVATLSKEFWTAFEEHLDARRAKKFSLSKVSDADLRANKSGLFYQRPS